MTSDAGTAWELRLYVTGATPRSLRAIRNIRDICTAHIPDRHTLEIVDMYQQPEVAATEQLLVAPTLVRLHPLPVRRLVGDLSDRSAVLTRLGIPTED